MFTATGRYLLVSQSVPWIVLLGTARREHRGPRMRPLFDMGYSAPTSRLLNTLSAHRIREELVDRNFVSEKTNSVNDCRPPYAPFRTGRKRCDVAFTLTKEAVLMVALLSSLGLWAAIWAAAASLASAWLQ